MIHENRVELEAIIDTGNRLYEPIECRPVSIVESAAVRQYFNETDRKRISSRPISLHRQKTRTALCTACRLFEST